MTTHVVDLRLVGAAAGSWLVTWWGVDRTSGSMWLVAWVCLASASVIAGHSVFFERWAIPRSRLRTGWARARWPLVAVLAGVAAGAASCGWHLSERDSSLARSIPGHTRVAAEIVLSDDPRQLAGGDLDPPRFLVHAMMKSLHYQGRAERTHGRLIIFGQHESWLRFSPGHRLIVDGQLAKSHRPGLTAAVLYARAAPRVLGEPPWYQRVAGELRAGLREAARVVPQPARGLVSGLSIGDTSHLDSGVAEDFRTTGMSHLTAVSGANVAIVTGAVIYLARWCRAGPIVVATVAGAAVVGFVVVARPSPSVLRAAVMAGIALIALALGRLRAAAPALAATVIVLVLYDPDLARSAGFALSVIATASLILVAPLWRDRLRDRGLPAGLAEAVATCAAAQLACTPLLVVLSGQISLIAVLANLLVAPAVPVITVLGVLAAAIAPIWLGGSIVLAWLAGWPARWLVFVAELSADLPWATLHWFAGWRGGLVAAIAIGALVAFLRFRISRLIVFAVLLVIGFVIVPINIFVPAWPPPWNVVFCDVGQGDAAAIRVGTDAAVVIDTGPEPRAIDRCLSRLRIRRVPLLMLSHLHADHRGGVTGVLRRRKVGGIAFGIGQPTYLQHRLRELGRKSGVPVRLVRAGWSAKISGVTISAIFPQEPFVGTRSDPNNNSLVLRVAVRGGVVLFAGDAELAAQRDMLASQLRLSADVLKVPHHGSAFFDPRFLAAVRPRLGVISVGADNDYGHPHRLALSALRRSGTRVVRTDKDGDCAVMVNGRAVLVTRSSS